MKILHGFLSFVFWLIILSLGLWMVADCFGLACPIADRLLEGRTERLVVGGALVVLVVIYWLSAIPVRRKERSISYECEGCMVSVSVRAINSLLSRLEEEFAAIESLRADVSTRDRSVTLDITVKSGTQLQELSQALQQRVRESMENTLGISDVGAVKVLVKEIAASEDPASKNRENNGEWQNMPI